MVSKTKYPCGSIFIKKFGCFGKVRWHNLVRLKKKSKKNSSVFAFLPSFPLLKQKQLVEGGKHDLKPTEQ